MAHEADGQPAHETNPAAQSAPLAVPSHGPQSWERFETGELAIVCSHFDLGIIHEIKAFHRGSKRSPKVVIKTQGRDVLLKRRAPGRDDPARVDLAHQIQEHVVRKKFPAPAIIPTREGKSWLTWRSRVYELFEYVRGTPYEPGEASAEDAGRALAWFHRLVGDLRPASAPTGGGYHRHPSTARLFERLAARDVTFRNLARRLGSAYDAACERADRAGLPSWPTHVIHGDWHPGNMIHRTQRVVAVVDYDAARQAQRMIDVANGALQFSIDRTGRDPDAWADDLPLERIGAFIRGYDGVEHSVLSQAELQALPWLMIEALIVESVGPVAMTGNFGGLDGFKFLEAVHRRVQWLSTRAGDVTAAGG